MIVAIVGHHVRIHVGIRCIHNHNIIIVGIDAKYMDNLFFSYFKNILFPSVREVQRMEERGRMANPLELVNKNIFTL